MAEKLASLAIELSADIANFKSDLGRANRESKKAADKMQADFEKAGKAIGLALGTGIAIAVAAIGKSIKEIEKIGDIRNRINVTAEALSGLGFAAKQSGSNLDTLTTGLTKLSANLSSAATGSGANADLFRELGVEVRDAAGNVKSADQVFIDLAERFRKFKDGPVETALAIKLFGKAAGPELVPLLNEGAEGIDKLRKRAEELGVVITDEAATAAKVLGDNISEFSSLAQGAANSVATQLLPTLVNLSAALVEEGVQARKAGNETSFLSDSFKFLLKAGVGVAGVFEAVGTTLGTFAAFLVDNIPKQVALLTGFAQAAAEILANPFKAGQNIAIIKAELDKRLSSVGQSFDTFGNSIAQSWGEVATKIETRIRAIESPVKSLGETTKKAAEDTGSLVAPVAALGKAETKTTAETKALDKAISELNLRLRLHAQELRKPIDGFREYDEKTQKLVNTFINDLVPAIRFTHDEFAVLAVAAQNSADAVSEAWEQAGSQITDAISDALAGGFDSFQSFFNSVGRIQQRFFSDLINQTIRAGDGFAGLAQRVNQGSMFGEGGTGFTVQGAVGAAGSGLNAWQQARAGNETASVLGFTQAGAQIGGIWGAVIGAIVGLLVVAFTSVKPPDIRLGGVGVTRGPERTFDTALGRFQLGTRGEHNQAAIIQAVQGFDRQILDMVTAATRGTEQIDRIRARLAAFASDLKGDAATPENLLNERLTAIVSTFDQATQDLVAQGTNFQERLNFFIEALERPLRLNALIESLEDAFGEGSTISAYERAVADTVSTFDNLIAQATALGATQLQLTRIEELRTVALERLAAAQQAQIDDILDPFRNEAEEEGLTPIEVTLLRINRQFDALRTQLEGLGATSEELAEFEAARARAMRDAAAATIEATAAITTFINDVGADLQTVIDFQAQWLAQIQDAGRGVREYLARGGGTNSLNPLELLQRAQADFEGLARRAALGDVNAIRQITGSADNLLRQAGSFFGVGSSDFQRFERLVTDVLTPIGAASGQDSLAGAITTLNGILQVLARLLGQSNGPLNQQQTTQVLQTVANALDRMSRDTARAY